MSHFLSYGQGLEWLEVAPYGTVLDRQSPDRWDDVSEQFGYFLDRPQGRPVGFKVLEFSFFDSEDPQVAEIFSGPRFTVPALAPRT